MTCEPSMRSARHRQAGQFLSLLALLLTFAGCALPVPFHDSTVLTQHDGRPSLHRLSWGYPYVDSAAWSPDGQWIAVLAGPTSVNNHLAVISRDGQTHHDLATWNCADAGEFDFAWLPDGRLSCVSGGRPGEEHTCISTVPPFASCQVVTLPRDIGLTGTGSGWSADGQTLWISAPHVLSVTGYITDFPDLFVLTAQGTLL